MDCPNCGQFMRAVLNEDGETVGYFCDSCRTYDSLQPVYPPVHHHQNGPIRPGESWGVFCPYTMEVRYYPYADYSRVVWEVTEQDKWCTMRGGHSIVLAKVVV